ncbi:MAG: C-GCAxxG-C-C family (seleno)protein [Acidobacteriota bacterium]
MEANKLAKRLYLSGQSNSAHSLLQGLKHHGLIDCPDEVLQATLAFERGLGAQQETCSCLVAAAMAAGLATVKAPNAEARRTSAEKICAQVIEEFRKKYQTTRCTELIASFPDFNCGTRKGFCSEIVEFTTRIIADLLTKQEIDRGSFSLTRCIDYLNRLPDTELTMETVSYLMQRVDIRHEEIEKCLNFSEESYARNLFYKNDRFEILVMCWDKGQMSPIHDHDESFSVEKIYTGEIMCTNYRRIEPDTDEIEEVDAQLIGVGGVIYSKGGEIHKVANQSMQDRAVSIHFYAPPMKRMKCFTVGNKNAQWMKLRYLYIYRPEVWQSLESCNL